MNDAMQLSLYFIKSVIELIPNSPLMWLFGMCIVLSIFVLVLDFATGKL